MVFERAWNVVKEGWVPRHQRPDDWVPIDPSEPKHPEHHEIWDQAHEIFYEYDDYDEDWEENAEHFDPPLTGPEFVNEDFSSLSMRDLANFFKSHVFPQQNPSVTNMARAFPQFISLGPSDEIREESGGIRRRLTGEGQGGGRMVSDIAKKLENELVKLHGQDEYQRHMDGLFSSMALEGER